MTERPLFPIRLDGEGATSDTSSAVVLVRVDETQFHLGLRRSNRAEEPVLHLAWHRRLRDEPLARMLRAGPETLPAAVVVLSLDPYVDEALQILSRRVARLHANSSSALWYGFGENQARFDTRTGLLSDPDAAFTCTTFVLALLRSVGVHLLDPTRWRAPTEQDIAWQHSIGERLLAWIDEYVQDDLPRAKERVTQDIGSRRFRPTDTAGAALLARDKRPAGAEDVEPLAQKFECVLHALAAAS